MITLRFKDGLVYYTEVEHVEDLEKEYQAHFLSDEKVAGKIDHPLTYQFIKGLLEKDAKNETEA